ncbi:MAG: hypothetical protein HY525_18605 [Betaproteobacteria bacterium]|nr:hypothetical protein [Betaproteobacteria bacterium]
MEAENLGIPSLVVTTTGFTALARLTGKASGIEELRTAEYPGPLGVHEPDEIRKNVERVLFDKIIDGLTKQSAAASSAAKRSTWNPGEIVFSGTFEQVNDFFSTQEWSDGLPIVPPTRDKVARFLEFTSRAPDQPIAILPSANLQAVPWNIAANGVMAGCRPEHMPLLVAAVEALGDERCALGDIGSTSGLVPFLLVNGPIARQLGIHHGPQLISRGANPAIGRAVGLIVRNIAGYRPGRSYMGTFGYPLVFTLGEDEGASPWEPFHVEQGFARSASTVTVGITNNWGPSATPYSAPDKNGAQTTLDLLCKELPKKVRLLVFPERGPDAQRAMLTILLSPSLAKSLANAGYSKQDVKNYLYANTRISLREFHWLAKYTNPRGDTVREQAEAGVYSEEFLGKPDDKVRLLSGPEILHIVVCGDPNRNRMMSFEGGHTQPTTKEIKLPPRWHELLKANSRAT